MPKLKAYLSDLLVRASIAWDKTPGGVRIFVFYALSIALTRVANDIFKLPAFYLSDVFYTCVANIMFYYAKVLTDKATNIKELKGEYEIRQINKLMDRR